MNRYAFEQVAHIHELQERYRQRYAGNEADPRYQGSFDSFMFRAKTEFFLPGDLSPEEKEAAEHILKDCYNDAYFRLLRLFSPSRTA
jgi:hypothetical protein